MRRTGLFFLWMTVVVLAASGVFAKDIGAEKLLTHLPKDPLLVSVMTGEDLAEAFDGMLDMVGKFSEGADTVEEPLAEFDAKLGCSVRDDVLAAIGPDFAFALDLPPVDSLMASMMVPDTAASTVLGQVGLVASVRERESFDACLRKLLTLDDGVEIFEEEDLVRVSFPLEGSPADGQEKQDAEVNLYYGYRGGLFSLGASPDGVRAYLGPRSKGERLVDGADFARVLSHLDENPERVIYLNLPKVREMVMSSAMLQGLIGASPEAQQMVEMFLSDEFMAVGLGTTSVKIDGGMRTTSFGPEALSGGAAMMGVVAAIAVPNLLNAIDRGKQKRTMADIRSAGIACEAYAIDNERYPSTDAMWVPLSKIGAALSPAYIRELPGEDGWGHPLMYWSDGENYRVTSPGKDGEMSQDWSDEVEGGPTTELGADIVFADGSFVVWPEGSQE